MKLIRILFLLALPLSVNAQTIVLGTVPTKFCSDKDTLFVPYQASGAFNSGNVFKVHLSDANGSLANFQLIGSNDSMMSTIAVPINRFGTNPRVLVASSDPFVTSDTSPSMSVLQGPKPAFWATRALTGQNFGNSDIGTEFQGSNPNNSISAAIGFAGETWTFAPPPFDKDHEFPNTSFQLHFPADANILAAFDSAAIVTFAEPGLKTVSIATSSPDGCPGGSSWTFYVAERHPVIPRNARAITADMGTVAADPLDTFVWVKSGGSFKRDSWNNGKTYTVYAEPGSSISGNVGGTPQHIYLRPGAAYATSNYSPLPQVIITSGSGTDTFYVSDLTFDYSQVNASVKSPETVPISIRQSADELFTVAPGPIEIKILNLLGTEVVSKHGAGTVGVDLSPLPAGVYFAIVDAGGAREVRRIAVVH